MRRGGGVLGWRPELATGSTGAAAGAAGRRTSALDGAASTRGTLATGRGESFPKRQSSSQPPAGACKTAPRVWLGAWVGRSSASHNLLAALARGLTLYDLATRPAACPPAGARTQHKRAHVHDLY